MASSEHLRVFIGNLITREPSGALCSATNARANFGSPPVRETANRASSEAHRNLRAPPRTFGFRTPSGVRRPSSQTLSLSRLAAKVASSDDFGLPLVRYNRHRASSDAHRNFRVPLDLLEIQKPSFQSHRLAVIELLHLTVSFVGHELNCAPFSGANGGQLCGRPQTFVSLTR